MYPDTFPYNSEIVKEQYKKDNYKVIETGANSKKAIIFFASNGLYFPDNEETFKATVIEKDRYEWLKVSKDEKITDYYSKIIFVRDIYKKWCVNGINKEINTLDKVVELLKGLTEGYEITTCGNSAGGYLSMICGTLLKAEKIFSFSGQFSIVEQIEKLVVLKEEAKNPDKFKYYDLSGIVKKGFYFYPSRCENDILQHKYVENNSGICSFPVVSSDHGSTVDFACYKYLFTMSEEELMTLHKRFEGKKEISPGQISKLIVPFKERVYSNIYRTVRKVGKKIRALIKK